MAFIVPYVIDTKYKVIDVSSPMRTERTVRVTPEVYDEILRRLLPGEIPDDLLRRELGLAARVRTRRPRQSKCLQQSLRWDHATNRLVVFYGGRVAFKTRLPTVRDNHYRNWLVRQSLIRRAIRSGASKGQLEVIQRWLTKRGFLIRQESV